MICHIFTRTAPALPFSPAPHPYPHFTRTRTRTLTDFVYTSHKTQALFGIEAFMLKGCVLDRTWKIFIIVIALSENVNPIFFKTDSSKYVVVASIVVITLKGNGESRFLSLVYMLGLICYDPLNYSQKSFSFFFSK